MEHKTYKCQNCGHEHEFPSVSDSAPIHGSVSLVISVNTWHGPNSAKLGSAHTTRRMANDEAKRLNSASRNREYFVRSVKIKN